MRTLYLILVIFALLALTLDAIPAPTLEAVEAEEPSDRQFFFWYVQIHIFIMSLDQMLKDYFINVTSVLFSAASGVFPAV